MRRRTLVLLILVVVIGGGTILLARQRQQTKQPAITPSPTEPAQAAPTPEAAIPAAPTPIPTQPVPFAPVVVARVHLPVGEPLTRELLAVEMRPEDNLAIQAGVTFDNPDALVGSILKTEVAKGQEILKPMLALNPTDLAAFGSDLALYVDQGRVAVAFPIDRFVGAAYALRPGDRVDVLMSLTLLQLDAEFQSTLPNLGQRVDEEALLDGQPFLLEEGQEGRLEPLNLGAVSHVVEVRPGDNQEQIPRRVTQLTLQQVEVLWMGTWFDSLRDAQRLAADGAVVDPAAAPVSPTPTPQRPEERPDVVILSLPAQEALVLKWALEAGLSIHLALRAQGDQTVFVTTSVSLPQMVEQGGLTVPAAGDFGLSPRFDEVPTPGVPALPPGSPQ
ncbi:MAG: Flp pilus assembly protein CpaB [Chloroflexota bacterium]